MHYYCQFHVCLNEFLYLQGDRSEIKVNESVTYEVTFKNPLPRALTNCELYVEAPGIQPRCLIKEAPTYVYILK